MDDIPELAEHDFIFYSLLYSSITVVFAMAVLTKFLTNEFRFGFRSILSLVILFIGEPMCHFLLKGPSGVALFGLGCFFVYSILPASHLPVGNKAVLVTGCDSGFGHALVKKLDSIGMRVFAGCLFANGPGAIELQNTCSNRLKIVQLDVTKSDEIETAVEVVKQSVDPEEGLWGLVNNAGVFYIADIEMTSEKVFRQILDINLFGMVRITKAFLPLVRKAKGRVVNMSSLAGRVPLECMGAYCVTKSAIETYSDVLRLEMKKWDILVSIIEPSGFKTAAMSEQNIRDRREEVWKYMDEPTKLTYGREYLDKMYSSFENTTLRCPTDLTPVIRAIRSGLLSKRPREKYPIGRGAETLLTIFPVLPFWIGDKLASLMSVTDSENVPVSLQKQ